jgi:hypothetical protein
MVDGLDDALDNKVQIIHFEYTPANNEKKVSMSLRLSEKEKVKVLEAAMNETNQANYAKILEILSK